MTARHFRGDEAVGLGRERCLVTERRLRGDEGFTLPELLMAMSLITLIMGAIVASLLVVMGPDRDAERRLAASHDAQLAALYLPTDLQSTGDDNDDVDLSPAALPFCASSLPGQNVLRLKQEQTDFDVSYRVVPEEGEWRLIRFACEDGGGVRRIVVGHDLRDAAAVSVFVNGARVRVVITSSNGVAFEIIGTRRVSLPGKCSVTSLSVAPASVPLGDELGHLVRDVQVTIATAGGCGGFSLRFASNEGSHTLPFSGTPLRATIGAASYTWAVGQHPLEISEGGFVRDEVTLTVTPQECVATILPTPATVVLTREGDLTEPVAVDVSTTGPCTALELAYRRAPGDTEQVMALGSAAPYAATILTAGPWEPGPVELSVRAVADAKVAGTAVLTVEPACGVSTLTIAPATALLAATTLTGTNTLDRDVSVTATAVGSCGALEIVYNTGTEPDQVRPLVGTGPFTYTIGANDHTWTTGSKTIAVREVDFPTPVLRSGTLTVEPACRVNQLTVSPSTANLTATTNLDRDLLVTASPVGHCGPLEIVYNTGTGPDQVRPLGTGPYTYTIGANDHTWTGGSKTTLVREVGFPTVLRTRQFTINVPCIVTRVIVTPSAVTQTANGNIDSNVSVVVENMGTCGQLEIVYNTGTGPDQVRPLGRGPYAATIGANDHTWVPGSVTITVRRSNNGTVLGSGTLVVNAPPCEVTSVSDVSAVRDETTHRLLSSVEITVTTTGACADLQLSYDSGENPNGLVVVPLVGGPTTWTYTILGDPEGESWSLGRHVLTVLSATGSPFAVTGNLTVT